MIDPSGKFGMISTTIDESKERNIYLLHIYLKMNKVIDSRELGNVISAIIILNNIIQFK